MPQGCCRIGGGGKGIHRGDLCQSWHMDPEFMPLVLRKAPPEALWMSWCDGRAHGARGGSVQLVHRRSLDLKAASLRCGTRSALNRGGNRSLLLHKTMARKPRLCILHSSARLLACVDPIGVTVFPIASSPRKAKRTLARSACTNAPVGAVLPDNAIVYVRDGPCNSPYARGDHDGDLSNVTTWRARERTAEND